MFLKIRKNINLCIKRCHEERHADLLLTGKEDKRNHAPIKDFNTFMYHYTLHREKKICLLALITGF